jgi:glycosyltransferase involved in cell wall biosynthesis
MVLCVVAEKPRISCIISTYSDIEFVEEKISEIQKQTIFEEAEFIFVETNSPEHEREVIRPYTEKFSNIRLITRDERKTLYEAWNIGWQEARADIICNSNMDDALHPRCLEYIVARMDAEPSVDLCSVMIAYQNQESPGSMDSFDPDRLKKLKIGRRPGPFSAWRKNIDRKIGMFDEHYKIMGDMDFWSQAAHKKLNAALIKKVLYLYTIASSQLSKRSDKSDEKQYAVQKGIKLDWHPKVAREILFHRKIFTVFPRLYMVEP